MPFLDVAALLIGSSFDEFGGSARLPVAVGDLLDDLILHPGLDTLVVVRAIVAYLAAIHERVDEPEEVVAQFKSLLSSLTTVVAACVQGPTAGSHLEFRLDQTYPSPFLDALTGRKATIGERKAFDALMVVYADHERSPSTVTARTAIRHGADYYSAVLAALSIFSGRRHGDELSDVMRWADEQIVDGGVSGQQLPWTADSRLVPGFGHSVYVEKDPRASILLRVAEEVESEANLGIVSAFRDCEAAIASRFGLRPNVHFFASAVLMLVGVPASAASGVIAVSRLAGWTAHVVDELRTFPRCH